MTTAKKLSREQMAEEVAKLDSTSKKIRFLSAQGLTTSQVERSLEDFGVRTKEGRLIRYQFVRNVLMTKLSK